MRPLVGLTSYLETAAWGVWRQPAALAPATYLAMLTAAGARVVLLPPDTGDGAPDLVARLDGLVLAGGSDIDPAQYGQPPHAQTVGLRPDRDATELALLTWAAADPRSLPVLGICRGMQLMAVAAGGALHQHLPDVVGHEGHRPQPARYGRHGVRLAEASLAGRLLGEAVDVPSYHHQGVATTGALVVSGWADDGTVEAVEDPSRPFWLGVLWHPEVGDDPRLAAAFVAACR